MGNEIEAGAPAAPSLDGIIVRRVELPSGGWAELRDPREVRTRDRKRALAEALGQLPDNAGQILTGLMSMDGLAILLVEKWSAPYAPFNGAPRVGLTVDDLDALEIPDMDALTRACEPAQRLLFPQIASPDNMRPGSPTPPAGG